nr:Taste receptor type 1 member 1 like [Ipomoea batatas]
MAWQMFTNQDKLWVKVMHDKYVKHGDFLQTTACANGPWGWRSILKGRNVLTNGLKWKVGNGSNINFWNDWWTGEAPLASTINDGNTIVPNGGTDAPLHVYVSNPTTLRAIVNPEPPPPPVEETELRRWPLNFLESKLTAGILLASGLGLIVYAGISTGDWKEFYQYFRQSRFIHAMSIDFVLLSAFAPFWVFNDMTTRKWYNKGSWLLPVSVVPFLGVTPQPHTG